MAFPPLYPPSLKHNPANKFNTPSRHLEDLENLEIKISEVVSQYYPTLLVLLVRPYLIIIFLEIDHRTLSRKIDEHKNDPAFLILSFFLTIGYPFVVYARMIHSIVSSVT